VIDPITPRTSQQIGTFAELWGLSQDSTSAGQLQVEPEKIQELTKLIGRRLREACGDKVETDLPVAIASRLAALQAAEAHRADGLQDDVLPESVTSDGCAHSSSGR
jgi:hypothetical protein